MSRLGKRLRSIRRTADKALGIFVTNGFPDPGATLPILHAIDAGGADFIELGMPFSDPLAEGIPIQRASERSLANGTTMRDTLDVAAAFRRNSDTPLVLMGYVNPILRFGVSDFFKASRRSGVEAVIIPDLPPEEASLMSEEARSNEIDLVFLIAPTSPDDRIREIDELAQGFVYAVSITGLTGTRIGASLEVSNYLKRARKLVRRNPLLVGFGISSHEDFRRLSEHTDGCIVGSALIRELDALWKDDGASLSQRTDRVRSFVYELKNG